MLSVLALTFPFFAIVALGFFAAKAKLFEDGAVRALNTFVFNFAMPALVVGALAKQDFGKLIEFDLLAGWLVSALIIFAITAIIARVFFQAKLSEMALFGQASSVGNVGFLAIPLVASAFGAEAIRIPAALLVVDLMVLIPISLALIEASSGGTPLQAVGRALKGAVLNPFCLAISSGVILSATGIGLPGVIGDFADFLAAAASPTALFALGLSLVGRQVEGGIVPIGVICLAKLLIHPALVFAVLVFVGVDSHTLAVAFIVAAAPVAGNVFVIAEAYGVLVRRASSAILVSTIAATITMPIALLLIGV